MSFLSKIFGSKAASMPVVQPSKHDLAIATLANISNLVDQALSDYPSKYVSAICSLATALKEVDPALIDLQTRLSWRSELMRFHSGFQSSNTVTFPMKAAGSVYDDVDCRLLSSQQLEAAEKFEDLFPILFDEGARKLGFKGPPPQIASSRVVEKEKSKYMVTTIRKPFGLFPRLDVSQDVEYVKNYAVEFKFWHPNSEVGLPG